jgi:hypothetical protein
MEAGLPSGKKLVRTFLEEGFHDAEKAEQIDNTKQKWRLLHDLVAIWLCRNASLKRPRTRITRSGSSLKTPRSKSPLPR